VVLRGVGRVARTTRAPNELVRGSSTRPVKRRGRWRQDEPDSASPRMKRDESHGRQRAATLATRVRRNPARRWKTARSERDAGAWSPPTEGSRGGPDSSGRRRPPGSGRTRSPPRAGSLEEAGSNPTNPGGRRRDDDRSGHREVLRTANPMRGRSAPVTRRGPAHRARASEWSPRSGGSSTGPRIARCVERWRSEAEHLEHPSTGLREPTRDQARRWWRVLAKTNEPATRRVERAGRWETVGPPHDLGDRGEPHGSGPKGQPGGARLCSAPGCPAGSPGGTKSLSPLVRHLQPEAGGDLA
jgi:hypothetical protein